MRIVPVIPECNKLPTVKSIKSITRGNPDITVDIDSTIWFSTNSGLVHYLPKRNLFRTYTHDPNNPGSLGSSEVYSTYVTRDKRLLVGVNADPIYEFDRNNQVFKEILYKTAHLGNNNLKYMQEDENGLI